MILEIITPDKNVFSGEIKLIRLPGSKGSFEILKNHAPIISTLQKGTVKTVGLQGDETFYDISGGVVEASNNKVIVLVEAA